MKPYVNNPTFTPEQLRELQDLWIRRRVVEKNAEEVAAAVKTRAEPVVWSPSMTLKECARKFGLRSRNLEEQLRSRRVTFERLNRQSIRVRASDIPPEK